MVQGGKPNTSNSKFYSQIDTQRLDSIVSNSNDATPIPYYGKPDTFISKYSLGDEGRGSGFKELAQFHQTHRAESFQNTLKKD